MPSPVPDENFTLLSQLFGAAGHLWSIGTLAGFMGLDLTGAPTVTGEGLVLSSGAVTARLRPGARALAFETISSAPRGWNHGIALCLPRPTGGEALREGLAWLSQDDDAIHPVARHLPVLQLRSGASGLRCLFRPATADHEAARALSGQPWPDCEAALAGMQGHWIMETPFLRAETETRRGPSPIHTVPQAAARGLTHAVTTPVPEGWLPLAHIFPPHPARHAPGVDRPFDAGLHAQFQAILAHHGRPDLTALKAEIRAQLAQGRFAPPKPDRHGLAVIRVSLRQWLCETGSPPPRAWLEQFDRPFLAALEQGCVERG